MTNRQRIVHLLRQGVKPKALSEIFGCSVAYVYTTKWKAENPDKADEHRRVFQRKMYTKQAARNGLRPSNETILSLAKSHTYNQIADRFGISRNVIAGVVNRSKRA